ncbi:MAG: 50S ribosomal protein L21, partial [Omnitrophica WOR_2 bacterium RBG_13_44_8b]
VSKDKQIEVGKPYLKSAKVIAVVLRHFKAKKAVSFKYRRRKSSHWSKGHRQQLTRLKIKDIELG